MLATSGAVSPFVICVRCIWQFCSHFWCGHWRRVFTKLLQRPYQTCIFDMNICNRQWGKINVANVELPLTCGGTSSLVAGKPFLRSPGPCNAILGNSSPLQPWPAHCSPLHKVRTSSATMVEQKSENTPCLHLVLWGCGAWTAFRMTEGACAWGCGAVRAWNWAWEAGECPLIATYTTPLACTSSHLLLH